MRDLPQNFVEGCEAEHRLRRMQRGGAGAAVAERKRASKCAPRDAGTATRHFQRGETRASGTAVRECCPFCSRIKGVRDEPLYDGRHDPRPHRGIHRNGHGGDDGRFLRPDGGYLPHPHRRGLCQRARLPGAGGLRHAGGQLFLHAGGGLPARGALPAARRGMQVRQAGLDRRYADGARHRGAGERDRQRGRDQGRDHQPERPAGDPRHHQGGAGQVRRRTARSNT